MPDDVSEMIFLFQSINQFISILSIHLRNVPDDILEMVQDNDAIFLFRNVPDDVLEMVRVMMLSYYLEMCQMMYWK